MLGLPKETTQIIFDMLFKENYNDSLAFSIMSKRNCNVFLPLFQEKIKKVKKIPLLDYYIDYYSALELQRIGKGKSILYNVRDKRSNDMLILKWVLDNLIMSETKTVYIDTPLLLRYSLLSSFEQHNTNEGLLIEIDGYKIIYNSLPNNPEILCMTDFYINTGNCDHFLQINTSNQIPHMDYDVVIEANEESHLRYYINNIKKVETGSLRSFLEMDESFYLSVYSFFINRGFVLYHLPYCDVILVSDYLITGVINHKYWISKKDETYLKIGFVWSLASESQKLELELY